MKNNYTRLSEKTKKPDLSEFAKRLNYVMLIRDCTNLKLSKCIYVSPSTISSYRRGQRQPSFDILRDISLALGVSTDFLLGLSDYIVIEGVPHHWKPKRKENHLK